MMAIALKYTRYSMRSWLFQENINFISHLKKKKNSKRKKNTYTRNKMEYTQVGKT